MKTNKTLKQLLGDIDIFSIDQFHNKNQYLIWFTFNSTAYVSFQSYDSLIAVYDRIHYTLYINWDKWDYSKTTLKHLKLFVNSHTSFRYETKAQFLHDILSDKVNILTFVEY